VVFRFLKCRLIAKKNEVKYSRTCCILFILKCDDGSKKFLVSKIVNLLPKNHCIERC